MKVVIPGGSGQIGAMLARRLQLEGHEVVVLSRRPVAAPWRCTLWDPREPGPWQHELDGCDVLINLAGRSVNCRYTPSNRREILESRVQSVQALARAIAAAKSPPPVWLQAGTATIYGHRYDAANDEATGILSTGAPDAPDSWRFSFDVATAWEGALTAAVAPRTRKVILRSAVVMSPDPGGIFDTLLSLVRRGLGGTCGDGRQFVSWIHEHDFCAAVLWLIERSSISGPINLCSPEPRPNREFMAVLRHTWGMPIGLPAASWMLEIGAWLMSTETELLLKSRRVHPGRLLEHGFVFRYPHWEDACAELVARRRG